MNDVVVIYDAAGVSYNVLPEYVEMFLAMEGFTKEAPPTLSTAKSSAGRQEGE